MNRFLMIALLLAVATTNAHAVSRKCPPKCKHRTQAQAQSCPLPRPTLRSAFIEGLELQSGFRWQTETVCPTLLRPRPDPVQVHDPFFVGVGVRLPIARQVDVAGNFDRDFTDESRWQARTALVFRPWSRR